jgi:Phage Mu protein F like protein
MLPADRAQALAEYIVRGIMAIRAATKKPKPWKRVHAAVDSVTPSFKHALTKVFSQSYSAISITKLHNGLKNKDVKTVETALDPAIATMKKALEKVLPSLVQKAVKAGGDAASANLTDRLGLRASARPSSKIAVDFDVSASDVKDWVTEHVTGLVDDLSKTTVESLREAVLNGFEEGKSAEDIGNTIAEIINDSGRAETISMTEAMTAANAGQRQFWLQAQEKGALPETARMVWVVTDDDALCPECEEMEDEESDLDGLFGDGSEGPPLHPNCRCTVDLAL